MKKYNILHIPTNKLYLKEFSDTLAQSWIIYTKNKRLIFIQLNNNTFSLLDRDRYYAILAAQERKIGLNKQILKCTRNEFEIIEVEDDKI